jgi:hypothetical protein
MAASVEAHAGDITARKRALEVPSVIVASLLGSTLGGELGRRVFSGQVELLAWIGALVLMGLLVGWLSTLLAIDGRVFGVLCVVRGHAWRSFNPTLPPERSSRVCRWCRAERPASIPRVVRIGRGDAAPIDIALQPGESVEMQTEGGLPLGRIDPPWGHL